MGDAELLAPFMESAGTLADLKMTEKSKNKNENKNKKSSSSRNLYLVL
jgi:hypothetical protein